MNLLIIFCVVGLAKVWVSKTMGLLETAIALSFALNWLKKSDHVISFP